MDQLDLFENLIPTDGRIAEFEAACQLAAKCPDMLAPIRYKERNKFSRLNKKSVGMTEGEITTFRLRVGKEVLADGGSISEFARRTGIVSSWASEWLKKKDPDLHGQLLEQAHPVTMSRERRIARLRAIQIGQDLGMRLSEIAEPMNIAPASLRRWIQTWAPDGIEDALYLETDDELAEVA